MTIPEVPRRPDGTIDVAAAEYVIKSHQNTPPEKTREARHENH